MGNMTSSASVDAFALTVANLSDELQTRGGDVLPSGRTVADVLSEVASKKHLIGTLPPCRDDNREFIPRSEREGLSAKMAELKRLNDMVEELEKFSEQLRIEDVVRRHNEAHPPLIMDCCICLEDLPFTDISLETFLPCCGNNICAKCVILSVKGGKMGLRKCPCCRADMMLGPKEFIPLIEIQATKGKSWAQTQMGIYYLEGSSCQHGANVPYQVDHRKALEWLRLAAEQRQPDAIRILGQFHYGVHGKDIDGVEFSHVKARSLLKEAADLGNLRAQSIFGMMCQLGEGGPVDEAEAVHQWTLAMSQKSRVQDHYGCAGNTDDDIISAAVNLGSYYYNGTGGLTKNLFRAKSYLEEAVLPEYRREEDLYLAGCLVELHHNVFGRGDDCIPGYSPIPRALALYKKSAEKMSEGSSREGKCSSKLKPARRRRVRIAERLLTI
ncbi:hypothetical protein ACHAXT_013285 [Thalassiosira profunda]